MRGGPPLHAFGSSRLGFAPTRHALSRIAKEGRKYGCFLGVVTQRPGELDPTVLSQCSTVFAMRLANERDQEIIRSAIADSSASTLNFLSSMGQREAIAFGEGVATTMRLKFERVPTELLPGSTEKSGQHELADDGEVDLARVVNRMRNISKPQEPNLRSARRWRRATRRATRAIQRNTTAFLSGADVEFEPRSPPRQSLRTVHAISPRRRSFTRKRTCLQ